MSLGACPPDVLRGIAAFLGPRAAGRVQGVSRRWRAGLAPRRWHAGTTPLLPNLRRLLEDPVDVLVGDDPAQAACCYVALEAIATGEIPCPPTLVLRPVPPDGVGLLPRVLATARDVDLSGVPLSDGLLGALRASPGTERLGLSLCTDDGSRVQCLLAFAYAHCDELVLRVETARTLRCLVCALRATPGGAAPRLRSFALRTGFANHATGLRREGLPAALGALPASVTHVDWDLSGAGRLGDLADDGPPPPRGTLRLRELRLGLMHTQITARGLRVLLGACASVAAWHLDLRHNRWRPEDWSVLADLCRALSTAALAVTGGVEPGLVCPP